MGTREFGGSSHDFATQVMQQDNVRFLEKLEVGKEFKRFTVLPNKRWKFETPANLLAARLVSYIDAR